MGGTAASPPSAVADLQKINHELQKLQVNDDSDDDGLSVFSDSLTVDGTMGERRQASEGWDNGYHDELQARHRRSSGHQSPAATLRNFAPSPSPHSQRTHQVQKLLSHKLLLLLLEANTFIDNETVRLTFLNHYFWLMYI